jgi:anionic cell wall polymer biosynthesis LytR-Cps2A-Psr (LCP) family protein
MDFSGFTKAVDLVGGIEVNVVKSFDDYLYPVEGKEKDTCGLTEKEMDIPEEQAKTLGIEKGMHQVLVREDGSIATASASIGGKIEFDEDSVGIIFPCRYEHISFEEGISKMDGENALKFVRSRHGTNGEGSDFARSKRQQLVITAFKNKVLSTETLFDIGKISGLLKTFGESIDTDIPQSKYPDFLNMIRKTKEIKSLSIDALGKNPLLITPPTGTYGAWVLIPPNNDFSYIRNYVNDFYNGTDTATKSAQPTQQPE